MNWVSKFIAPSLFLILHARSSGPPRTGAGARVAAFGAGAGGGSYSAASCRGEAVSVNSATSIRDVSLTSISSSLSRLMRGGPHEFRLEPSVAQCVPWSVDDVARPNIFKHARRRDRRLYCGAITHHRLWRPRPRGAAPGRAEPKGQGSSETAVGSQSRRPRFPLSAAFSTLTKKVTFILQVLRARIKPITCHPADAGESGFLTN
jgi:hypothetical protein